MNKQLIQYGVLFFAAVLLQATFVPSMEIGNSRPDLILIALVIFSLNYGSAWGCTVGFVTGIVSDLISGNVVGFGSLAKTITGYIAGGGSRFFKEGSQFIFTLVTSGFAHDLILFGVRNFDQPISWRVVLVFQIVPNLSYTALLGTLIYFMLGNSLKREEGTTF